MQARLIVTDGKASKREITFRTPSVIGRSREADLTIAHPLISRHHCELYEVDGLLMVRDLGSLNGTAVDRRRVLEAPLKPGDQFSIGPLTFRVEYEYAGSLENLPEPRLDPKQEMPPKSGPGRALEKKAADESAEPVAEPSPPPARPPKTDEGPPPQFDAPSPRDEGDTEQEEHGTEHVDEPESTPSVAPGEPPATVAPEADEIAFEEPEAAAGPEPPAKPERTAEPEPEATLNFQPEPDQSPGKPSPEADVDEPIIAELVPKDEESAPQPPKPEAPPAFEEPPKKKQSRGLWPFGGKKGKKPAKRRPGGRPAARRPSSDQSPDERPAVTPPGASPQEGDKPSAADAASEKSKKSEKSDAAVADFLTEMDQAEQSGPPSKEQAEPKSDSDAESTKDSPAESQDAALNDFLKGLQ